MYIAIGQRQTTPRGQNFDVNRHLLSLRSFATSLKKFLWSLILYTFFHDFIHVYSPGARADNPLGTKFWCQQKNLVTSVICCKFLPIKDFLSSNIFPEEKHIFHIKSIKKQIWPCHKKGQGTGHHLNKLCWPKFLMLHNMPQGYWPFGSREEDF